MSLRKLFFTGLIIMISAVLTQAQRPEADKIETKEGDLVIQPILHGSLMLGFDGKTIYVDPYGGAKAFAELPEPDLILITDIHGDHLDEGTLKAIGAEGKPILTSTAVKNKMSDEFKKSTTVIDNGEQNNDFGFTVEAIPMYNLPETEDSRHVKGRGNGYVLNLADKRVYISGDTEDIPEMRQLKNIDVAFVCMNMPYTMDINQAASAVLEFQPKIVYPFHYRGRPEISDTEAFKKLVDEGDKNIEVRLRNWYPTYP